MDYSERGAAIARRLETLGISTREFQQESRIDRKSLKRAIAGEPTVREATYAGIESHLNKLEAATGVAPIGDLKYDLIEVRATKEGPNGRSYSAVVKGPVADVDLLRRQVALLVNDLIDDDDARGHA